MSEHIKTTIEIGEYYNNLCEVEGIDPALIGDYERKCWVSLSWLKEQINNEIKTIDEQTLSMHEFGARDALRWVVIKVLEDKL